MTSRQRLGQTKQGMMGFLSAIFPAPVLIRVDSRNTATGKAASRRPMQLPRSRLQQAIWQGLQPISLAAGMASLLVAYNLRDTIAAHAAQWLTSIVG